MIKADVYTTLRKQMIIQFYFLYKKFEKISTLYLYFSLNRDENTVSKDLSFGYVPVLMNFAK